MSIKREDLLAAAAAGVLQHRQIDRLLVFVLQRDVKRQREEMMTTHTRGHIGLRHVLFYIAGIIGILSLTYFATMYARLAFEAVGVAGLLWFTGLYAAFTVALAEWFERRKFGVPAQIFTTSIVALIPLAVFAALQIRAM